MDSILRVVVMYAVLVLVFRLAGKRTLSEATTFDFLMLLVISETTQEAMVDDDHSMTHAFLLILTFLTMNIGLSVWKQRSKRVDRVLDGVPIILVQNGRPHAERMKMERVDENDVLEAARELHGIESLDEIKFAILERGGHLSIIPTPRSTGADERRFDAQSDIR